MYAREAVRKKEFGVKTDVWKRYGYCEQRIETIKLKACFCSVTQPDVTSLVFLCLVICVICFSGEQDNIQSIVLGMMSDKKLTVVFLGMW